MSSSASNPRPVAPTPVRPPAPSPVGNRAVAAAALDGTLAASVERIARLAATVLAAPATLIALVGDDRRCFGGGHALPGGLTRDPGVLVRSGLYARAVDSGTPLALEDARLDKSSDVAGAARELGIAGYLGMPLLDDDGNSLGVFCAFDSEPRAWTPVQVRVLRDLAALAANELTLRRTLAERERVERQLRRDALHDPLTGLPNRTLFMDRLSLAVQRAQRSAAGEYVAGSVVPLSPDRTAPAVDLFAVLFLDLDDFKVVNDSVGHHGGDELLVAVARRLEECIRGGDVAARFGGDEFAILLERVADARDAASVAARVQDALSRPFMLGGYELFSSASIGVALSSSGAERAEYMLRSADMAMYRAKNAGRARYEVFDPTMHAQAFERLQLEADLRRATEREEFALVYQPVVSVADGTIVGAEALVRWFHPERGMIPPESFIPAAEETGLIIQIGGWVIGEACRQLAEWRETIPAHRDGTPFTLAVNLSAKQFTQPDLVSQVTGALRAAGVEPGSLTLEVTESVFLERHDTAAAMIVDLKRAGVRVHLDDFGTGYSSLGYLHRLPFDGLKVDRAFVSAMDTDERPRHLVRTILTLGRELGLHVTAEGVTNAAQVEQLREMGCRDAQGYFFSAPLSGAELARMATDGTRW